MRLFPALLLVLAALAACVGNSEPSSKTGADSRAVPTNPTAAPGPLAVRFPVVKLLPLTVNACEFPAA